MCLEDFDNYFLIQDNVKSKIKVVTFSTLGAAALL